MVKISKSVEHNTPKRATTTDVDIDVLSFARANLIQGSAVALCTLVEIRGGSSRALGAHMAVQADGFYCGHVSGGCVESAIAFEALEAIKNGTDRFVMIGEGSPFFDIVLPCGGGITVAIHILRESTALDALMTDLDARRSTGLSYNPGKQSLLRRCLNANVGWHGQTFLTWYRPRPRILISGRTLEVDATIGIARAAGYEVICQDPSTEAAVDLEIVDEYTALVLLHHDLEQDISVLRAALRRQAFYIGALGSSRTHEKRVRRLQEAGISLDDIARIRAPIGLLSKARDAHTLAISVVADVALAWQTGSALR